MKFNLFRPDFNKKLNKIVSREIKKQKLKLLRLSKKQFTELLALSDTIENKGLPPYLVRKKLPKNLGYGIFLHPKAEPLLKGQVIAPYSGELSLVPQNIPDDSAYAFAPLMDILITQQEHAFLEYKTKYHHKRLYTLNVDAWKKGNFTRFINHSEKPNVMAELFAIPKKGDLEASPIEVIYLVKKTIRPGEQLLVDYEGDDESYWTSMGIKPTPITPKTFRLDDSLKVIQK